MTINWRMPSESLPPEERRVLLTISSPADNPLLSGCNTRITMVTTGFLKDSEWWSDFNGGQFSASGERVHLWAYLNDRTLPNP